MHWRDRALLLACRRFNEHSLVIDVLTAARGRRSGLVYGGSGRRKRAQYEPGNTLTLFWTGRFEDQLGRFELAEATASRAARHLDNPGALAAIMAVTALVRTTVKEGDATGSTLFEPSTLLLDALDDWPVWPALYARWELHLLSVLGFGLDLETCALSGAHDQLTHVSPRTGRAIRHDAAREYRDRLLPLPSFLVTDCVSVSWNDIDNALRLTGHFLEKKLFNALNQPVPDSRRRLIAKMRSHDTQNIPSSTLCRE